MIGTDADWIASAAEAELLGARGTDGPRRVVCDSRQLAPGDLFVGLEGAHCDGSEFAHGALAAGAWGVVVSPPYAARLARLHAHAPVISSEDPQKSLAKLARAWRRELGARVVGVTGSTGKTSTKDILAALLSPHTRTHANRENFNTEIGLPLAVLEAERGVEVLVLEMAMRGERQIADLCEIAEPDIGVILNVGPVHLEVLGTVERVAAAKAELIRSLPAGGRCVVPADEPLLEPHLRSDLETITFGPGGDVSLTAFREGRATLDACGQTLELDLSYSQPYNVTNTVAAVAVAVALGIQPHGRVEVNFSALRGDVVELEGGVTVINDCYNANPMSMRAALEHLAAAPAARRIAVLGEMAELGQASRDFHLEVGERASELGIDAIICVGDAARAYAERFSGESYLVQDAGEASTLLSEIASAGDRALVKGSRSAGLERVLG